MKQYEVYKDSGIEWMGEIPKDWKIKRLKDYGKIQNGADYKDVEVEEGGFPVYGTGGIFKRADRFLHVGPSVLLGRKGTIDKPLFVDKPFWTVDTMFYTEISKNIDVKYFYYLCTQIHFDFYSYGSAIPSMTQKDLHTIAFPYPEKWEQKTIADYLDKRLLKIDHLIANKTAQIQQLQEIRQIEINNAVTKGLDAEVEMKDSGIEWLGEIPKHWKLKRLKDYGKIQNGADYKDVEVEEGGFPVYGTGGIFKRADRFLHAGPSVLLGRKGTIDKPLFVDKPFWTVDTMFYTDISKNIDVKYFYYLCTQIHFDFYSYGSAIPSMTQKDLHTIAFPYPEKWEQKIIADYLDKRLLKIDSIIANLQSQIHHLQEIRKIEIYNAVTGKVKVT